VRSLTVSSGKGVGVVGLKAGEGRIEHFPAGHYDHVESRWRLVSSEQLAGETLGSVPNDGGSKFPCSGNAKPTPHTVVGHNEQRHETPV
jgi:hypothetical protein